MSFLPIAVIVCTRDRAKMLRETLAALPATLRSDDEVVVVDSASRTAATREVAERAGYSVVRCERPGLSRARNAGVRATSAPIVAFLDDDSVADPSWAEAVRAGFDDDKIGFVTGRAVPDAPSRHVLSVVLDEEPRRFRFGDDIFAIGTGANMAFRREAIVALGGFDEALGAGGYLPAGEDNDAWWRVLRGGWVGRYVPEAVVVHRQWRGLRTAMRLEYRYGVGAGALAVKIERMEGTIGRTMLRDLLWSNGVLRVFRMIGRRYETGAAAAVMRTTGAAVGAMRARRLRIIDDLFVCRA